MTTWHKLASLDDIPDEGALETGTPGHPLALYKVEGKVYCTGNMCTHAEAFLSDGYLDGFEIECPLHGARFDIRDGRVLCQPASKDIATYVIRIDDGQVYVDIDP